MPGFHELPFAVFMLRGEAQKLLSGISTNTPNAPRNAFIDVYGKIISVFYQAQHNNVFYIVLPAKFVERAQKHLTPYMRLGKASLESTNLKAFLVADSEEKNFPGPKISERNSFIILSEKEPALEKMSDEEFKCFRLENGISMQGEEFEIEMIMNTDWKDAVSFTKGCYLGQEIVAKIMHRGRPPKKLVRILFAQEPSKVTVNGLECGEICSKCFSAKLGRWIVYCSIPGGMEEVDGGKIMQ